MLITNAKILVLCVICKSLSSVMKQCVTLNRRILSSALCTIVMAAIAYLKFIELQSSFRRRWRKMRLKISLESHKKNISIEINVQYNCISLNQPPDLIHTSVAKKIFVQSAQYTFVKDNLKIISFKILDMLTSSQRLQPNPLSIQAFFFSFLPQGYLLLRSTQMAEDR